MIQWVYERVSRVQSLSFVIVATDHAEIYKTVTQFGGLALMTQPDHPSGTDRIWEVVAQYPEVTTILNVQGDEPLVNPLHLEEAVMWLRRHHEGMNMITLKAPIKTQAEWDDPNIVKVVTKLDGEALYFSRASIPFLREPEADQPAWHGAYRHVGVYGFTRSALAHVVKQPPSPMEKVEKLEQLRALEADIRIHVLTIPEAPIGVDVPEDIHAVEPLFSRFANAVEYGGTP